MAMRSSGDYSYDRSSVLRTGWRIRYKVNNAWTPWLYAFTPGTGAVALNLTVDHTTATFQQTHSPFLYSGEYELQCFLVRRNANFVPNIAANTGDDFNMTSSPRVIMQPNFIG